MQAPLHSCWSSLALVFFIGPDNQNNQMQLGKSRKKATWDMPFHWEWPHWMRYSMVFTCTNHESWCICGDCLLNQTSSLHSSSHTSRCNSQSMPRSQQIKRSLVLVDGIKESNPRSVLFIELQQGDLTQAKSSVARQSVQL